MKTQVINIKDRNKYKTPPGETVQFVYVGRPTIWGNPFRVPAKANSATRHVVVEKFRDYLREHPHLVGKARKDLKGKVLICHCAPKECHADILAYVAEGGEL